MTTQVELDARYEKSKIVVIPTVEPNITIHLLAAGVEGNGLCIQIHDGGKIGGRAYVPWRNVPELEAAIHKLRDEGE